MKAKLIGLFALMLVSGCTTYKYHLTSCYRENRGGEWIKICTAKKFREETCAGWQLNKNLDCSSENEDEL